MNICYKILFIFLAILFLLRCNAEYGIGYGQPNTIISSVNQTTENYATQQRYLIYEHVGNIDRLRLHADNNQKGLVFDIIWELQGGEMIKSGNYTEININTAMTRSEHGNQVYYMLCHVSGPLPPQVPPNDLKGLKNQLVIEEFEAGAKTSPDKYSVKKLKAHFIIECKEKFYTDTLFQNKINKLEAYINVSQ